MKTMKTGIVLLALLLAGIAMVPMVSADDAIQDSMNEKIVTLFAPIDSEIQSTLHATIVEGKKDIAGQNAKDYSEKLIDKNQENLNLILDALEKEAGIALSSADREDMKRIIVEEHIRKVSWEMTKEKLGVKESDFKTVFLSTSESLTQNISGSLLLMPNSLTLVQVSADV